MTYILKHELIHFRRHDLVYKWLLQTCLCLHWFNPFLKRLEKEVEKACELSCDEQVMKNLDAGGRRAYGDTLLCAMAVPATKKAPAVMLLEGKDQLKERLGAIMSYQKMTGKKHFLGGFMAVMIGVCAVSTGAYASPSKAAQEQNAAPIKSEEQTCAKEDIEQTASQAQQDKAQKDIGEDTDAGEKSESSYFYYIQDSFYSHPYILEIGWNIPPQKAGEFPYSAIVPMTEEKSVTCYFNEETKQYMQAEGVQKAMAAVYPALQEKAEMAHLAFETPYLSKVRDVSGKTAEQLVEESYGEDLSTFAAVFPELEENKKEEYLNRMYQDEEVSFLRLLCGGSVRR